MTRTDLPSTDNDGVVVLPPAVFLAALLGGYAVWWFWPAPIVPPELSLPVRVIGGLAAVTGLVLMVAAVTSFSRAGTTPTHWEPTTRIVSSGPYQRTRNPMYIGMALVQAGLAMLGNALWPLLLVIPAIWIVQTQVVAREERYLEGKFGRDYLDYKARVRRWI
jgi:protein-S-isoprenylcysteine O-methyltransferase Ste14